jgi:hypothetical protein
MTFNEKPLSVLPPVEVAGRHVKRYHILALNGLGIEPEIEQAAMDLLPKLLPEPDGTPPATFIVVHRGGNGAAYLSVYTWVWDNVLHVRGAAAAEPELGCPDDDPTHFMILDNNWIGCVWELGPLQHERDAWIRHMLKAAEPDLDGYLADSMTSATTGGN